MASMLAYGDVAVPQREGTAYPARRVARVAAFTALAAVLGLVEAALPPLGVLPWLKPGLANIAVVLALAVGGVADAALVTFGRLLIVGMATASLGGPGFLMALAGASASLIVMSVLASRVAGLSPVGWSVAGSVAHVSAQLLTASAVLGSPALLALIPPSALVAVVFGALVGSLTVVVLSRLPAGRS